MNRNHLILIVLVLLVLSQSGGVKTGVSPIAGDGFRVLIVEESEDRTKLPYKQIAVLNSTRMRDYLDSHCATDGDAKAWRLWDQHNDVSFESKSWQDALPRAVAESGGHLPWVLISTGGGGTSEALPEDEDSMMALLQRYGGA